MNLTDFMVREGLNQTTLAEKLAIKQSSVSRILDRNRASVDVALRIEALTNGEITADALNAEVAAVRQSAAA